MMDGEEVAIMNDVRDEAQRCTTELKAAVVVSIAMSRRSLGADEDQLAG